MISPLSHVQKVQDNFKLNDLDEASDTVTYLGKEAFDGTWYIQKMDTTTGIAMGHATRKNNTSTTNYSDAWTARTSLSYGDYSQALG